MSDALRRELEAAGAELAAADAQREQALARISAALKANEVDRAVPLREAARLARVSRVTAYRLLERQA